MQPHKEKRADEKRQFLMHEARRTDYHDDNFEHLHVTDDARLVVFVRQLAGSRRKKKKRQDKKSRAQVYERARTHRGKRSSVKCEHDDKRVLVYVVVERTEKLRAEKRQKAPFA